MPQISPQLERIIQQLADAEDAAETYWEAWQDAAAEAKELRQRMRSGWRLAERKGIDQPQPLIEEPI